MSDDVRPRPAGRDDELSDELPAPSAAVPNGSSARTGDAAADAPSSTPSSTNQSSSLPATDVTTDEAAARHRGGRHSLRAKRGKERKKAPWWELPALIALAILIAIGVKTFLIQPFYIPSESMERTLHGCQGCSGDRILVNKLIYDFRDPHPGDIVVFHAPPGWDDEPPTIPPSNPVLRAIRGFGQLVGFVPPDGLVLVKRVIAVGGQTVRGFSHDNGRTETVQISDDGPKGPWRTLDEPFIDMDYPDSSATFGPVTVPKGRLWVMGDHRGRSADSRWHCDAQDSGDGQRLTHCNPNSSTVPVSDVIGKAFVIAWPPSRWRTLGTPSTFTNNTAAAVAPLAAVLPVLAIRCRRRRRR